MLIRLSVPWACRESEVTPRALYERRALLKAGLAAGLSASLPAWGAEGAGPAPLPQWLQGVAWAPGAVSSEPMTPYAVATTYNNFYEFGPEKTDPAREAGALQIEPWTVVVDGEVGRPGQYDLESLFKGLALQERIYRLRCVEAWSMVIPWLGFPLAEVLKRVEPTGSARYVRFETLVRPEQMPGVRSPFGLIDWPYVEGLRLDEAMHPLTLLAVGMYGGRLAPQNGAPLRLVVPWKYGFKSIKSIVRITLTQEQPVTTWAKMAPDEYGFYANVNPAVSHPRWSQRTERRLPSGLFSANVLETRPFNGYGEAVAGLYSGMDLSRDY